MQLTLQPNIIKIHNILTDHQNLYFFQELIGGGDLFCYMSRKDILEPLPEYQALWFIYQILQAVGYLHSRNVIHRDLKVSRNSRLD